MGEKGNCYFKKNSSRGSLEQKESKHGWAGIKADNKCPVEEAKSMKKFKYVNICYQIVQ